MKIQICKSTLSTLWYNNKIGQIFETEYPMYVEHNLKFYRVKSDVVGGQYVYEDDCEIIEG
jgi:hypothetical protein